MALMRLGLTADHLPLVIISVYCVLTETLQTLLSADSLS